MVTIKLFIVETSPTIKNKLERIRSAPDPLKPTLTVMISSPLDILAVSGVPVRSIVLAPEFSITAVAVPLLPVFVAVHDVTV
tara:strand:- start:20477 stop:20722 length:246 start_codon:yes stop_codon:yes gene_type:complete